MRRSVALAIFSCLLAACDGGRTVVPAGSITNADLAFGPVADLARADLTDATPPDSASFDAATAADAASPICGPGTVLSGLACVPGCPADMVFVSGQSLCIDKYEASQGTAGKAASVAGAAPWVSLTTAQAEAACVLAGKHLCTEAQWQTGCAGSQNRAFPYGTSYTAGKCNDANVNASIVATGTYAGCEGGYTGLFDMSGNAYERTATCDASGCRIEGGSYRSASSSNLLQCKTGFAFGADSPDDAIGFRCCH